MVNLCNDILYYISLFLFPRDKIILKYLTHNPYINNNDFRTLLLNELKDKILNPTEFLDHIDKTGVVISGSFMLKVITGDTWENNDIDIYERINGYKDIEFELMPFTYNILNFGFKWEDSEVYQTTGYILRYYKYENTLLNIIPSTKLHPLKLIRLSFDTNICKIGYYKGKLYVWNWLNIIYKQGYITTASLLTQIGYYRNIYINDEEGKEKYYKKIIDDTITKMNNRHRKYFERGYQLIKYQKNILNMEQIYENISHKLYKKWLDIGDIIGSSYENEFIDLIDTSKILDNFTFFQNNH
jgi:hypothetical protein